MIYDVLTYIIILLISVILTICYYILFKDFFKWEENLEVIIQLEEQRQE